MRRYPGFCRRAFEVLRCRTIKPGLAGDGSDALRVLSVDYSVACGTTAYDLHYGIAIGCLIIAAALPAVFIYKLRPQQSAEIAKAPDIKYYVSMKLAVSVEEAEEAPCAGSQKTCLARASEEHTVHYTAAPGLPQRQTWRTGRPISTLSLSICIFI